MSKLNIGCGRNYREGFKNWDVSRECKTDAIVDIRCDDFPESNEGADYIYISGVLEQIQSNEEFLWAMNECHRVLQKGKTIDIVVPNAESSIAWQDPFDCRRFTPTTFKYFIKGNREYQMYGSVYGFKPWSSMTVRTNPRGIMEITLTK